MVRVDPLKVFTGEPAPVPVTVTLAALNPVKDAGKATLIALIVPELSVPVRVNDTVCPAVAFGKMFCVTKGLDGVEFAIANVPVPCTAVAPKFWELLGDPFELAAPAIHAKSAAREPGPTRCMLVLGVAWVSETLQSVEV